MFETDLDESLRCAKENGLAARSAFLIADELVFEVSGYLLTDRQIVALNRQNSLTLQRIRDFDNFERSVVETDITTAKKNIEPTQLSSWTAVRLRDYINRRYRRNHSVGQILGVSQRLGIYYAQN